MGRMKEVAPEDRPRERLRNCGGGSLKVEELLAILMVTGGKGRNVLEVARGLLERFGGLEGLAQASVGELEREPFVGPAKAIQLRAAMELGLRLQQSRARELPMDSPEAVVAFLGDAMAMLGQESLRVVVLNTRLYMKACREVSRGSLNETVAHPRDILRVVLEENGYGFVLVHNHPSGDPAPSRADFNLTMKIRDAAALMEVVFLDHIIIGKATERHRGYHSFREAGYL